MLTPSKDYTAVQSFELYGYDYVRSVITTPPETCTKGAATAASFFRFRLVAKRVQYQQIAWADINTAAKWAHATNAFTDLLGFDVDQWDVCQYSDTQILVVFQKTGEDYARHKRYDDTTGWAADARNGISQTPPCVINAVPFFGHGEVELSAGKPFRYRCVSEDYLVSGHITNYVLGDPGIKKAFGAFSKSPIGIAYNASGELRFYYSIAYQIGINSYQFNLKWGRAAGVDLAFSQAGDTIFCLENGIISQGFNPFYMQTIYTFQELPCAKHAGIFYTYSGQAYTLTETFIGYIKDFSQDWKSFKCTIPELTNPYTQGTVKFKTRYNDNTLSSPNPMVVASTATTLFGTVFNCLKVIDFPAYSPLLHQVAESQPHLLFTHALPYCPVSVKNQSSSIYALLNRYRLVMSHDQGSLQVLDNSNPVAALTYDLYKTNLEPDQAMNVLYQNDGLTLTPDLIAGLLPAQSHNMGFLTAAIPRKNLIGDYAFTNKRSTFERPPQHFQVGDQVTIGSDVGMIDDITETFSQKHWSQNLSALVAPQSTPPIIQGNISSATVSPAGSISWDHIVAPGNNRLLIALFSKRAYVNTGIVTVTFGGLAMTKAGGVQQGSGNYPRSEIWYLVAPAAGIGTITATLDSSMGAKTDYMEAGAVDFRNVRQTTPLGTYVGASGAAGPASAVAVGQVGDLVIDELTYQGADATPYADQVILWQRTSDGTWKGASSTKPGGLSITCAWTIPAGGWAQSIIAIKWVNS